MSHDYELVNQGTSVFQGTSNVTMLILAQFLKEEGQKITIVINIIKIIQGEGNVNGMAF